VPRYHPAAFREALRTCVSGPWLLTRNGATLRSLRSEGTLTRASGRTLPTRKAKDQELAREVVNNLPATPTCGTRAAVGGS
jgi:hypothetical protein